MPRGDSHPKTLLLFVIRDHIGATPLENLKQVLQESLQKIWSELSMPEGFENSSMNDFFDFDYAALPHKLLQAEKFDEEAALLKGRYDHQSFDV